MKTVLTFPRRSAAGAERALREDHRRLERIAGRLAKTKDVPGLLATAEELRRALLAHFALEEHPGGLYDCLRLCVPQHRDELAGLVEDHHHLMVEAWQLCQQARAAEARFPELRKEARKLLRKLHEHEEREHRMARQAQAERGGSKMPRRRS